VAQAVYSIMANVRFDCGWELAEEKKALFAINPLE
jgi:hypothetical protein